MRNDRGQVQQAATSKVRQAAAAASAPATQPEAPRGAFGQKTDAAASAAAPQNRAERRAAGKKK